MPNAKVILILPTLVLSALLIIPISSAPSAHSQGIYQQTNYWCDMRKQPTGSGNYRNPMQVLYNDNQQPLTWRPMSEDINAQPNPPSPTPSDVINRDGGMGQVPGLGGILNAVNSAASNNSSGNASANASGSSQASAETSANGTVTQTSVSGQLSNYVMSETNPDYSGLINP